MRVAHLADCHLGFRAYTRAAPSGANQREQDVAETFARAIDRVIALAPDLVVIAGDVFHHPHPKPRATLTALIGFKRLIDALPGTPIVVAAGNHDLGHTIDGDDIMPLLATLGVYVAERTAQRFYFPAIDVSVLAVPDAPGLQRPALEPDPHATHNVLVLHGSVQGVTQGGGAWDTDPISRAEIGLEAWDYAAFGHFHQYEQIAPNAFYSGSIEFTSSNPWQEIATPKGFVERDLETGAHTFHTIAPQRCYLDLPPIDAHQLGAAEVDALIAAAVEAQPIDGAVVRLKVLNITREVAHGLDQKALRSYRKRALNFHLDERRADRVSAASVAMVKRVGSVDDRIRHDLGARELPNDVDSGELVALGMSYIGQAVEVIAAKNGGATKEPIAIELGQQQRGVA